MAKYLYNNKYIINFKEIMSLERDMKGHEEQMKKLFLDSKVIAYHLDSALSGGDAATVVLMPDGAFGLYDDYFGTCSGCDSWINAGDEKAKYLCKAIASNAKFFSSLEDIVEYLDEEINNSVHNWPKEIKMQILKYLEERK